MIKSWDFLSLYMYSGIFLFALHIFQVALFFLTVALGAINYSHVSVLNSIWSIHLHRQILKEVTLHQVLTNANLNTEFKTNEIIFF